MKVVIVGGVAGGASAAARLRRLDEQAEIVILERSGYVSYANCGLPYYVGGVITDREKLTLQTPASFRERFAIDVRVNSEVTAIDRAAKEVAVRNLATGEEYREPYDALILSPGARPVVPDVPGVDATRIFTLRTVEDTFAIYDFVEREAPRRTAVVGGGFIGVEMAENLVERGCDVSLYQRPDHVLPILDSDMAAFVHNHLRAHGVQLHLGADVQGFSQLGPSGASAAAGAEGADAAGAAESIDVVVADADAGEVAAAGATDADAGAAPVAAAAAGTVGVITPAGEEAYDMVVLAIGVVPESTLAREAGLELGVKGAIVVDEHMRTSDPSIYAVGDAVQVANYVTGAAAHIALAGPANKQGRIAADNICGRERSFTGSQGSSVLKVFDLTVAATGLTQTASQRAGIDADSVLLSPSSHATYYPGSSLIRLKVVYERGTGRILGAQAVGEEGVEKRIDVLATAIRARMDAYDLAELDLSYAPPYSSAKDPVNMAGFLICNILDGLVDQVGWDSALDLPADAVLVDVRTRGEYDRGHIEGALHIPVDELRARLAELPAGKRILVHCQSGLRSYLACRILSQHGYDCANVAGGYAFYEAVHTDAEQRTRGVGPCGM